VVKSVAAEMEMTFVRKRAPASPVSIGYKIAGKVTLDVTLLWEQKSVVGRLSLMESFGLDDTTAEHRSLGASGLTRTTIDAQARIVVVVAAFVAPRLLMMIWHVWLAERWMEIRLLLPSNTLYWNTPAAMNQAQLEVEALVPLPSSSASNSIRSLQVYSRQRSVPQPQCLP
jgi:hypothetical protein